MTPDPQFSQTSRPTMVLYYKTLLFCLLGRGVGRGGGGRMMPDPQSSQTSRPTMVQSRIEVASPYKGWKLYFPDEGIVLLSPVLEKIVLAVSISLF